MVSHQKKTLSKMVVLGDVAVGKTSLIKTYVNNGQFQGEAATQVSIGSNFESKTLKHEGLDVVIQLWDTAGQERFESLGYAFYRGSNCCMLVYDVSNRASFEALNKWKLNFISNASPADAASFPFMVVGNKSDLAE